MKPSSAAAPSLPRPVRYAALPRAALMGDVVSDVTRGLIAEESPLSLLGLDMQQNSAQFAGYMEELSRQGYDRYLGVAITEIAYAEGGGKLIELTQPLIELMLNTDFDATEQVPIGNVRLPYTVPLYIHAPTSAPELLVSGHDRPLPLDGFYVRSVYSEAKESIPGIIEAGVRHGIDIMCFSQPASADPDDDAHIYLSLQWTAEQAFWPVDKVIDMHLREWGGRFEGAIQNVDNLRPHLDFLLKALIYLNLADARRREVRDGSELRRRSAGLGPKKRKRLERQIARTYDRLIVGPETLREEIGGPEDPDRTVRPHLRRGHFRNQRHGEGLQQSRVVWIRPAYVNLERAEAPPAPRDIEVRS